MRTNEVLHMAESLDRESILGWMKLRAGWKRKGRTLVKEFKFSSFRNAIVFVNRVATLADDMRHHPNIDVRHNRVVLTLSTESVQGISEKDLALAEQVDFATSAH
jgi:4a-hydroxytetrahydrobiopterin dehydratase